MENEPRPHQHQGSFVWRRWMVGVLAFLLAFLAPLAALETRAEHPPEVRITRSGDWFSALVAAGDQQILLINSNRPDEATSALGRLRRPWEPSPAIIITPASDQAASGIHAALGALEPERVIIAGLPGADPAWSRLEQMCRERGIQLEYAHGLTEIEAGHAQVSILAPAGTDSRQSSVIVSRNGLHVALALGDEPAATAAQVEVFNGTPHPETPATVLVHPPSTSPAIPSEQVRVELESRDVLTVKLHEGRLRLDGGRALGASP